MPDWLDARRPAMPMALRQAVDAALEEPEGGPSTDDLPTRLADAGLAALHGVVRSEPVRSGATRLLVADALLTYAFEAAAEDGPEAVERLVQRLSPATFAALLEDGGT